MHGEERAYRDGPVTLEMNEKTANDSNEFRAVFMRNFEVVLGVSPQPFINHGDEGDCPPDSFSRCSSVVFLAVFTLPA